jgi:hypothetical protein
MFAACQKNLYLFTSELSKKTVIHGLYVHPRPLSSSISRKSCWLTLYGDHFPLDIFLAILGYQQPFNGTVIHPPTSKSLLIVPLWSYFPLYLRYKFAAIFTSWAGTVYCAYIQTALPFKGKVYGLFILSSKFLAQGLCFILNSFSASFKKYNFFKFMDHM